MENRLSAIGRADGGGGKIEKLVAAMLDEFGGIGQFVENWKKWFDESRPGSSLRGKSFMAIAAILVKVELDRQKREQEILKSLEKKTGRFERLPDEALQSHLADLMHTLAAKGELGDIFCELFRTGRMKQVLGELERAAKVYRAAQDAKAG